MQRQRRKLRPEAERDPDWVLPRQHHHQSARKHIKPGEPRQTQLLTRLGLASPMGGRRPRFRHPANPRQVADTMFICLLSECKYGESINTHRILLWHVANDAMICYDAC